jgi:hypothetical protein
MRAVCPINLTHNNPWQKYKLLPYSLHNVFNRPICFSSVAPNIPLSITFSDTFNLHFSLRERNKFSHTHTKTSKFAVLRLQRAKNCTNWKGENVISVDKYKYKNILPDCKHTSKMYIKFYKYSVQTVLHLYSRISILLSLSQHKFQNDAFLASLFWQ